MDKNKNKNESGDEKGKLKNIFFWRKIFVVFLVLVLVASLVLFFRNRKSGIFRKETSVSHETSLSKDPSFGLGGNYVREGSIGEPFYLGELINRGWWKNRKNQAILRLISVENENGDIKNDKELKGGEKIILNILLKNPESYPLVNIKIHGALKTRHAGRLTKLLNDFFLITPNSFSLAGGMEKKISFPYTIPENISPGEYSIGVGAVDSNALRYLDGSGFVYIDREIQVGRTSLVFSVVDGDKSFGLVSKDEDLDFEVINKENKFSLKNPWIIISYPQVGVRFKMFNDSQEAKNFSVRYDLINLFGGIFADLDKDLDKVPERASFTVKPRSTEEVLHEFNLEDYIKRAQKAFREKGFYWADNSFSSSTLQVLIEGEGRKYIVYFPLYLEFEMAGTYSHNFGISKFPIKKGETVDLFTGFFDLMLFEFFQDIQKKQSLASENNVSKIELLLKDKDGNEIGRTVYIGKVDGVTKGWRNKIKVQNDLDYLELTMSIYNNQGELERTMKDVYDCEKIEGAVCLRDQFNRKVLWTLLGVTLFFSGLVLALIIVDKLKKKNEKKGHC
jgi:hypothetical protein